MSLESVFRQERASAKPEAGKSLLVKEDTGQGG